MFLSQPVLGVLSLLFGVLLTAVLVLLAELLSRSVKDSESLEAELPYGVQYLGEIPRMPR
jgi:capsular polysaccharide biosynthesis protein